MSVTLEDGFFFMHPDKPISCRIMAFCSYGRICKKAYDESRRILSIPQSAQSVESANSSVYSPSVFYENANIDFFKADWPLVGEGVKHATCGTYWSKICLEKHNPIELDSNIVHQKHLDGLCGKDGVFVQRVKMSCHRLICPECWPDWRKRQVARAKHRFDAFEEDYNREEKRHVKRCHGAISVPKGLWYFT